MGKGSKESNNVMKIGRSITKWLTEREEGMDQKQLFPYLKPLLRKRNILANLLLFSIAGSIALYVLSNGKKHLYYYFSFDQNI